VRHLCCCASCFAFVVLRGENSITRHTCSSQNPGM
jgi:hypothetical protein